MRKFRAALLAAAVVMTGAVAAAPAAAHANDHVTYSAHVQSKGWLAPVSDGATAGTTGLGLRMEAFKASGIDLTYRAHVQSIGWQGWREEGQVAGTTGLGKRLEALQVQSEHPDYRVEYRAHVQSIGWQPWVSDGTTAGTTGRGLRVEALQVRLIQSFVPYSEPVVFTATADNGINTTSRDLFSDLGQSGADVNFILGDLAYVKDRETDYCNLVNDRVNFPTMLLAGNHESDTTAEGLLRNYVRCLPDRLGEVGSYAKDYYLDRGNVRFIMVSPNLLLGGVKKTYTDGTPEQVWLVDTIREAHAAEQWVVVGMHMPCLTLGYHGCDSSPDLSNVLIREKVDLVLSAHDHTYSRTHQLAGTVGAVQPSGFADTSSVTVTDDDEEMVRGAGTVFAIVGNGGHNPRVLDQPVGPLWAAASGTNSPGGITYGFAKVTASQDSLYYELERTSGGLLNDTFVIH